MLLIQIASNREMGAFPAGTAIAIFNRMKDLGMESNEVDLAILMIEEEVKLKRSLAERSQKSKDGQKAQDRGRAALAKSKKGFN